MIDAVLIDDEMNSLNLLELLLHRIGNVKIKGKFQNSVKALEEIQRTRPDAVFLDIEMPGINGISLAQRIIEFDPYIKIVFVTAYDNYAVSAFELNSVDYLLKPFTQKRLEITIQRLLDIKAANTSQKLYTNSIIEVHSFGMLDIFCNYSNETITWRTIKEKELFAYLLDCWIFNRPSERDLIIEDLWPNADYMKAKTYLHTCISYLKNDLRKIGLEDCLVYKNGKYMLLTDNIYCDAYEFISYDIVNSHNIEKLKDVSELYIGNYLDKDDFPWAKDSQEAFKLKYLKLLRKIINYYKKTQEIELTIEYLEKIIEVSPYSEGDCKELMELHIKNGNRAKAIAIYNKLYKYLKEDLSIKPDEDIRGLFKSIS